MSAIERVIVGISGGVDSAVAALRLQQAGYDVHGLHMTNWHEDSGYCTAAADYQAARQVCADLGIPLHRADFSREYHEQVFAAFLAEYAAGRTPNPDVLCNRYIKFGAFLAHARRLGADRIATGHYARLKHKGEHVQLQLGVDAGKDQTYFLHTVPGSALSHSIFPLGDLTKLQVREIANRAGFANYSRPDSTGICFIGERPFREFLKSYLSATAGPVMTPSGEVVGQHEGLMYYTLGQRSGIGIGGRRDGAAEPWYVAAKETQRNALIVVQGRQHPMLWSCSLTTESAHWINAPPPALALGQPFRCRVRIRHRHVPAIGTVRAAAEGALDMRFDDPQWAVTPGQSAVIYDGENCLGGAVISSALAIDRGAELARLAAN